MIEYLDKNEYFRTADLSLAAALQCCGCLIEAIDRSNPNKAAFLIPRDDELDTLVQDYWSRRMTLEPNSFFNSLKGLKARIYNE